MSDGEVLLVRGIWFQICAAAENKARQPIGVELGFHSENIQKRLASMNDSSGESVLDHLKVG